MAIIRHLDKNENLVNYIGAIGFFCAISCTIIMFWFRGFKASLNFASASSHGIEHYDSSPGVSLTGAYRSYKNEQPGSVLSTEPPKRITSSMVKLPGTSSIQSKSTSNLTNPSNDTKNIRKSAHSIPQSTNNQTPKIDIKKQNELEKQHLAEQKKQEELAAKKRQKEEKQREERERAERQREEKQREERQREKRQREERVRKEREKNIQQAKAARDKNDQKKSKKRTAPQPQQMIQETNTSSSSKPQGTQHSTNTLESSISKSSGPPPYSAVPEITPNQSDNTGNTSFKKPDDSSSWDIITQHRQEMSRQHGVSKNIPKQTHLDLQYNVGASRSNELVNSNA